MKAVIELLLAHYFGFAVYGFSGSKTSSIDLPQDDLE